MKKALYTMSSVLLVVLAIAGIATWEFYIKEKVNTTEVFVASKIIEPHTVVTEEHIRVELRDRKGLPPKHITNIEDIIGKEVVFGLDVNDVFTHTKINIVTEAGLKQNVFPIPNSWIEAAPGSLRKNDKVDIYIIPDKNSRNQTSQNTQIETNGDSVNVDKVAINGQRTDDKPILKGVKVAFVKDSTNQEVRSIEGKENGRGNLSAYAYQLELLMQEEQFVQIKKAVESGYKLLFSY
jgi:hypothetical protein